jgi:2-keto-3-deoxy-L-rhamnonate aldolase RhmA
VPQASDDHLVNPVKEKLKAGGVALGMTVRLGRSPDIARIARATGHDFLFIDGQHSIFNLETVGAIAHTALAIGIAPMVRVRGIDDPDVSVLLDNGVTASSIPMLPHRLRRNAPSMCAGSRRWAAARWSAAIPISIIARCRWPAACRSSTAPACWSA